MDYYPGSIKNLIRDLARLPGIGQKTAERLAMHILQQSDDEARRLAGSIVDLKSRLRLCSVCYALSDDTLCRICNDPSRNAQVICVVDKSREIYFIDNVKFHIDTVKNLGAFVEIEAIDTDGSISREHLKEQCDYYMQLLQIKPSDLIADSYSDMLRQNNLFGQIFIEE